MARSIHRQLERTVGIMSAVLACLLVMPAASAAEAGVDYLVTSSTSLRPDADNQRFVIGVRNITSETLIDLEIPDSAPEDRMVVSAEAGTGTYDPTSRTWLIPELEAGASTELVIITGRVADGSSSAPPTGPPFWPWWLAIGLALVGTGLLIVARRERRMEPQTS